MQPGWNSRDYLWKHLTISVKAPEVCFQKYFIELAFRQNHSIFVNERGNGLLPLIESWIITNELLEKTLTSSFLVQQALPCGGSLCLPLVFRYSTAA